MKKYAESRYMLANFVEGSPESETFFNEIDQRWPPEEGKELVSVAMKKKIFYDTKYTVHPFAWYFDRVPVGLCWVEFSTDFYGNITCYVPDEVHIEPLMSKLKHEGYFDKKIMEIVPVDFGAAYKEACFKLQLVPNIRQRMYLWLSDYESRQPEPIFLFRDYVENDVEWSAGLSVQAHNVSKDYVHYEEMKTVACRENLERRVFSGHYGDVIQEASQVVMFNGQIVGYCVVVEVEECWGYTRVPWIFDICIDPGFHGQGIGKAMSYHMLNRLQGLDYEIMGLAATLTNKYAISMYEKLGFQFLDVFYEFINPSTKV